MTLKNTCIEKHIKEKNDDNIFTYIPYPQQELKKILQVGDVSPNLAEKQAKH